MYLHAQLRRLATTAGRLAVGRLLTETYAEGALVAHLYMEGGRMHALSTWWEMAGETYAEGALVAHVALVEVLRLERLELA